MEKKWYYAVDGVRSGPVSFEELCGLARAGSLKELDLVWQPEFGQEWRNAGQVRGLFETAAPAAVTPPLTVAPQENVPLSGVDGARPSPLLAASQAYSRTVELLFRPFDMTRWFSIGFCAWLAYLGTQSLNINSFGGGEPGFKKQQMDGMLDKLASASVQPRVVALVTVVLLLSLLFALWMCSLRSRGDFMFLHRWYRPDTPIRDCWLASQAAGRELFAWRLRFFLISFLLFALDVVLAYVHILQPYLAAGKVWSPALVTPTVACVTAAVLLSLGVQLVAHLAKAFVVPVMYWHGVTASRAWLAVFALCNRHPIAVLGYLLVGLLCGLAAAAAYVLAGLLTCCIGFVPLALPYFGAVALLPVYLFFRGYAVCFLSQWRPELVPAAS